MIEGLIGFGGTILGVVGGYFLSQIPGQRARKRHSTYLAQRVTLALDEHVSAAATSLEYAEYWNRDRRPERDGKMPPALTLPGDVDWTSINPKLSYDLQRLPYRYAEAKGRVSAVADFDSEEAAEEMHRLFRDLALDAAELADRLRNQYGLPARDSESAWDPVQVLRAHRVTGSARHPVIDPTE